MLVEDNPGHARLVQKNLQRAKIGNKFVMAEDGQQAIDYFFNQDGSVRNNAQNPHLILLDLNLPGMDGYQVLRRLKETPDTKHIPVIVLTTTDNPDELEHCYELGCNAYITKPVEYEAFSEAIQRLGLFLLVASLPGGSERS